jgi:hypothetical protein
MRMLENRSNEFLLFFPGLVHVGLTWVDVSNGDFRLYFSVGSQLSDHKYLEFILNDKTLHNIKCFFMIIQLFYLKFWKKFNQFLESLLEDLRHTFFFSSFGLCILITHFEKYENKWENKVDKTKKVYEQERIKRKMYCVMGNQVFPSTYKTKKKNIIYIFEMIERHSTLLGNKYWGELIFIFGYLASETW